MTHEDLAAWCDAEREEAKRQIELFEAGGVKALLEMPDGSIDEITDGVVRHQRRNVEMFEKIAAALKANE